MAAVLKGPLKTKLSIISPKARNMVRSVLLSRPDAIGGLSSQQIYNMIHEKVPETQSQPPTKLKIMSAEPPHPGHPIQSMRFLKKFVLEDLAAMGEVEKVCVRRSDKKDPATGKHLYMIKSRWHQAEFLPPSFTFDEKEAWLWRLKPKDVEEGSQGVNVDVSAAGSHEVEAEQQAEGPAEAAAKKNAKPRTVVYKKPPEVLWEDETETLIPSEWEGKLRFQNVKDIALRYPTKFTAQRLLKNRGR